MKLEICIDVDDVDRAVEFYGRGLGLEIPQVEKDWAKAVLDQQGGKLDRDIQRNPDGGAMANLSDPAGNGIDLVQPAKK